MDEPEQPDPNHAHRLRMARKKAVVDEKIAQGAQRETPRVRWSNWSEPRRWR
jgi:hypothetical protein